MISRAAIYILGFAQIIIQFAAAYLSFKIYSYNRVEKSWLAVTLGLAVMAIGKGASLAFGAFDVPDLPEANVIDGVILPFVISILMLIGIGSMLRQFHSFDIIERKAREHIGHVMRARAKD